MNNQQPPQFVPPTPTITSESADASPVQVKSTSIKVPIILMVWPVITLIAAIALYALTALIASRFESPAGGGEALFASSNISFTLINVLLFFAGTASVALGPISFITGLVLLIVRLGERKKTTV